MKRRRESVYSDTHKGFKEAEKVDDKESESLGPSFDDLPSPIIAIILHKLPIKSLLICRSVCTSWRSIIQSDPYFSKLHFESAPVEIMIRTDHPKRVSRTLHLLEFDPEKGFEPQKLEAEFKLPLRDANKVLDEMLETKSTGGRKRSYIACKPKDDKFAIVNSCNGLLCLCDPEYRNPLAVCNPITGEFIRIPEDNLVENWRNPYERSFGLYPFDCGFGFVEKTNEYKVVRLYTRYIPRQRRVWTFVEIHTVGTELWRSAECIPHRIRGLKFPTYLRGSLHWFSPNPNMKGSILCFNLENERFQSFPSPPCVFYSLGIKSLKNVSMGELRGFLYVCGASSSGCVHMWMMKKYGVAESWIKAFSIHVSDASKPWLSGLFQPIKLFEGGGALMYHSSNSLIYYHPKKKMYRVFEVRGAEFSFEAISYNPSFISLKDVVKEDNVEALNVYSRCAAFKLREEKNALFLVE